MQKKFSSLSSKGFIIALVVLLLNDFVFKAAFHNWFTGKLSDAAGLFIFPIFWSAFFPKHKKAIYFFTAFFFIYWKSPFSQSLIDSWNYLHLFSIQRIVDYSDLLALLMLPVSFYYSDTTIKKSGFTIHPVFPLLLASFSFVATSQYKHMAAYDSNDPFYNDPLQKGKAINVTLPAYTIDMQPSELMAFILKYNIAYLNKNSSDSVFITDAFNTFDRLPPLVKVRNTLKDGKTIIRIESVIFDSLKLNKSDHYQTKNAEAIANEFAGWFIPKLVVVKSTDSLSRLGASLWQTNPDSSAKIYNAAIKIAPQWLNTEKMLNYGLGNAYFYRQQYQQALVYFYRADSLNSLYSNYRMRADPYYGLADTYKKLGQKDSVKKYKKLAANGYPR